MVSVNTKTLRLLALLEHAPKYGQQLCRLAPELFSGKQRAVTMIGKTHDGRVYSVMGRIEKQGFIKRMSGYVPPKTADVPDRSRNVVVWYGITSQGLSALQEIREALQINVGEPPC
jgi:DNA-binding PadR family transcriptional regulator